MSEGKGRSTLQAAGDRLSAITATLTGRPTNPFPAFDDLPKVEGQPQGCTWGLFDHPTGTNATTSTAKKDEIGTLNLLTPAVVAAAASEISTGEHIQLDWSLDNVQFPGFGRKEFNQTVVDLAPLGFKALDDEIYINTQSGSQWDSLKHFAHQKSGMYYNGLSHEEATKSITNGIHSQYLSFLSILCSSLGLPFSAVASIRLDGAD